MPPKVLGPMSSAAYSVMLRSAALCGLVMIIHATPVVAQSSAAAGIAAALSSLGNSMAEREAQQRSLAAMKEIAGLPSEAQKQAAWRLFLARANEVRSNLVDSLHLQANALSRFYKESAPILNDLATVNVNASQSVIFDNLAPLYRKYVKKRALIVEALTPAVERFAMSNKLANDSHALAFAGFRVIELS